ncbi:DUF7286 family protein [Natrialbaceae archaeon A-gly3]
MGERPSTVTLATDDRARIPFALIGVLLLVSSATLVGVLESRPDPETDVDPSLAMDRTAAASQTVLRDAVVRATDDAALRPVTDADTSDPWGRAIDAGDDEETFERYLALRIYLEVEQHLQAAGQEIREDTTSSVSVPPLSDSQASAEDALDRVDLEIGRDAGNDLDPGTLEVTVEDVTITVERDGRVLAERTQDVTVTVATTAFELHEKADEYEEQLDMGFFEADGHEGLGRHFAARMYPLSWARGYAQYGGAPISEVVANRHVEVMANDAVFTTQEAVFGTTDPHSERTMMNAWGCLAAKDAEELYGGTYGEQPEVVDAEDICDGLEYIYGDVEGDLPDPPDTGDLLEGTPGMDETETIEVNEMADLAFAETLADGDIEGIVEDLHEVDVSADVRQATDDHNEPSVSAPSETRRDSSNWRGPSLIEAETTSTLTVDHREHDPDATTTTTDYHTFDVRVTNEHYEKWEWDYRGNQTETGLPSSVTADATATAEFELEITLSGTHPSGDVNTNGVDNGYNTAGWPHFRTHDDYASVPEDALEELLDLDPDGDLTSQLEDEISSPEDIESASELEDEVSVTAAATVDAEPETDLILKEIAHDLATLRDELGDVEHEFERHEIVQGDPFDDLRENVDDEDQYVYEGTPGGTYDSVADKARVEARQVFLETLVDRIDDVAETHTDVQDGLEDELGDEIEATDNALAEMTDFAQDALVDDVTEQDVELEGSPLLENVTYTPSGSPTYLSLEVVEREEVPAAGEDEHAPMAAKNDNWFAVPYTEVAGDLLSRVLSVVDDDEEEVVTLRTAGEMLESAELADKVADEAELEEERGRLENEIERELENIATKVADEAGGSEHLDVDEDEVEEALIEEALPELGTVDQQAIRLGGGEGAELVRDVVKSELEPPDETPYDDDDVWKEHAASVVKYELMDEIDEGVVDGIDKSDIEEINDVVREQLEDISEEVIRERLENQKEKVEELEEKWLMNEDGQYSPNRVPSGLPITPVPGYWIATANVWDVEFKGEYARFELQASSEMPSSVGGTTYVRDGNPVEIESNDGTTHIIGETEPITFSSRTMILVVVPPSGVGVGDRTDNRIECSETWPDAGPEPHDPKC